MTTTGYSLSGPQNCPNGWVHLSRRWGVERTFGRIIRWRRLVKDYEQRIDVAEAMIHIAMGSLMLRQNPHPYISKKALSVINIHILPLLFVTITFGSAISSLMANAYACTRVVYHGPEGRILTGRSMDFKDPMTSNFWIFPRGEKRHGAAGLRSMEWMSKFGSVAISAYDVAVVDGMNEVGLNASLLWLNATQFPKDDGITPRMSLSIWAQFYLDQFSTVVEAIEYTRAHPIEVVSGEIPGRPGSLAPLHLALSDASGDSAVLEWVGGKLAIHHSRDYQVVTNDPTYELQLANRKYWGTIDPLNFLPGSGRSEDRFIRASFYINAVTQSADAKVAAASVFSVIRSVSVPYGISIPGTPNLSTTRWRLVSDQKSMLVYGESVVSPSIFWVDLKKVDFSKHRPVCKLDLGIDMSRTLTGEVSKQFLPAGQFGFLEAK